MLERSRFRTFNRIEINPMTEALIAFGANLGDAQSSLDEAVGRIADHAEIEVVAVAKPLVTAAVSGEDDANENGTGPSPDYLNSAIRVKTTLTAELLFQLTRGIENEMGRQRRKRWGPRTIDLDIILFGDRVIDDPDLQVPHPRMSFRNFVMSPAADIGGDLIDPVSGVSLNDLVDRLQNAPAAILWIAGEPAVATAKERAAEAIGGSSESGWSFRVVNGIKEGEIPLNEFRLMIFSDPEESFEEAALRFAGPWLNLTGLGETQCRREIRAAIQAMTLKLD